MHLFAPLIEGDAGGKSRFYEREVEVTEPTGTSGQASAWGTMSYQSVADEGKGIACIGGA
jgi:hypothetical protein